MRFSHKRPGVRYAATGLSMAKRGQADRLQISAGYLRDPTQIRDPGLSEPMLQPIGQTSSRRYGRLLSQTRGVNPDVLLPTAPTTFLSAISS